MRQISLDELSRKFNVNISELENELRTLGLSLNDIRIYVLDYIPMRLQHLFFELRDLGLIIVEARVVEGKLILLCANI